MAAKPARQRPPWWYIINKQMFAPMWKALLRDARSASERPIWLWPFFFLLIFFEACNLAIGMLVLFGSLIIAGGLVVGLVLYALLIFLRWR